MADLPRLVVLGLERQQRMTYFKYVSQEGRDHRRLQLSSPVVASATEFTRLEVERAPTSVGRNMVHIKSTYNNKYLVLESANSTLFVAGAHTIEEDRSKWSCTLFAATFNANGLNLVHQSNGGRHTVILTQSCLGIVRNSENSFWFQVTNMGSLAILPKYVAFKGNNNLYLSSIYIRTRNRLQFASEHLLDPNVHHETIPLNNGNVRLKSTVFGQLWRKSNPEWIWCDTNDSNTYDQDTTYRPVRLNSQDNTIALQNLANNKYCMRWVRGGQPRLIDTLTASADRIEPLATFTVVEAIRERLITNIRYKVNDARRYNSSLDGDGTLSQDVYNELSERVVQRVGFTFARTTQRNFSASHSWKVSLTTQLRVTLIPVLAEGDITFESSYAGSVEWSESTTTSVAHKSDVLVPVPPRSKVTVTLLIGHGSIDVPYSYTQTDTLLDSSTVTTNFEDGIFTGTNTVATYHISEATPLSEADLEEIKRASLEEEDDDPKEDLPPPSAEAELEEMKRASLEEDDDPKEDLLPPSSE